jgi:hypothetical protein
MKNVSDITEEELQFKKKKTKNARHKIDTKYRNKHKIQKQAQNTETREDRDNKNNRIEDRNNRGPRQQREI